MAENFNKDIITQMNERYRSGDVELGHKPTADAQRSIDDHAGGLVAQALRGYGPSPTNQTSAYLPHPPQSRFTREEIRQMIAEALPEIKERQAAKALDLTKDHSHHGYGY